MIENDHLRLEGNSHDRYGRVVVDVYAQTKQGHEIWPQGKMPRQRLAFVYPLTGTKPHLQD